MSDTSNDIFQLMGLWADSDIKDWPLLQDLADATKMLLDVRDVPPEMLEGVGPGIMSGFIFGYEYAKQSPGIEVVQVAPVNHRPKRKARKPKTVGTEGDGGG